MATPGKAVPDGFNTVSVHLIVRNAAKAIEFYAKAFGAEEVCRMPGPDGESVAHAELRIGNSTIMMCEEAPQMGSWGSPEKLNGTTVGIHLYVEDADALYDRAVAAGATPTMPMMDAFWGDRFGKVTCPFGHQWAVATHKQDLTPEEIEKGAEEFFANMAAGGSCGS